MSAEPDPRITAFLDAVDDVLNSNTLLVCVAMSGPDDLERVRRAFRPVTLEPLLRRADVERDWDLFHHWEADPLRRVPTALPILRPVGPVLAPLTVSSTRERLLGMLTAIGFASPHHRERDLGEAVPLVDGFLEALAPAGSRFYDVDVDLLFHHGEADGAGFRDGFGSDTITAIVRSTHVVLLFTNGMA